MRTRLSSLALLPLGLLAACASTAANCPAPTTGRPNLHAELTAPETLTVTLDGLTGELDDRHVFGGFGCTGQNHSPAISWSGAPEGTQSYVLEVHDPDAPTGVGFFHWIVADLPAGTTRSPTTPPPRACPRASSSPAPTTAPPAGAALPTARHPTPLHLHALRDRHAQPRHRRERLARGHALHAPHAHAGVWSGDGDVWVSGSVSAEAAL